MTDSIRKPESHAALLQVVAIALDTLRENVVLLARDCSQLRPERLQGTRSVEVSLDGCSIEARLLILDDPSLFGGDEIGMTQPALRRLGVQPGQLVHVLSAPQPKSLDDVGGQDSRRDAARP